MNRFFFFTVTAAIMLFTSCAIEDEVQCITSLDCAAGLICIDGLCVEDNGETQDNSMVTDNVTQPDDSVVDNEVVDETQDTVDKQDEEDTDEIVDEKSGEVADEIQDTADTETVDKQDEEDTDETVDESSDEVADETVDETPDETVDETIDEAVDETPDEDTATPLTCATAGLTCGSNSHCDDSSGTPKCVCDTNYQDEDGNGTCLVSCTLWDCNTSAFGNNCYISGGVATCSCNSFDGYTGTHCDECSYGYHLGGFGIHDNECFEDNCNEAEDPFHGWLDCWGSQVCDDSWGYAECTY